MFRSYSLLFTRFAHEPMTTYLHAEAEGARLAPSTQSGVLIGLAVSFLVRNLVFQVFYLLQHYINKIEYV